nr:hypothetical protein BHI3_13620 [Bacteriovorax sp. HI3]
MVISLFIYIGSFFSLLFLPEKSWTFLWEKARALRQWSLSQKKTPPGEKLLKFLPELEAKMGMGMKTAEMEIPHYKFYTSLLHELLEVHRKLGVNLKSILPELRNNVIKDLQFEKKVKGLILGGNLQFAAITMTTWGFIWLSSSLADLPLHPGDLFFIFCLQALAILVFNFAVKKAQALMFNKFSRVMEGLYLFISMAEVGLSAGRVLADSKVLDGDLMRYREFSFCAERVKEHVQRWRENGVSPRPGVTEVVREVWHLQELCFEKFLKVADLIKFSVLAVFFLPAYFFYLYSIFQYFVLQ